MCGIVGIYNKNGSHPWVLQQMIDLQRHRGPDDRGMRLFSFAKFKGASYELSDGGAPVIARSKVASGQQPSNFRRSSKLQGFME